MNTALYTASYELSCRLFNSPLYKRSNSRRRIELLVRVLSLHRSRYIDRN